MANLADQIEQYLRNLLAGAAPGGIEVQRRQLAELFGCAPSQINYVLETRFTTEKGYVVESRRGGGGYIRILRCSWPEGVNLAEVAAKEVGDQISAREADRLLTRLEECGWLGKEEGALLRTVLAEEIGNGNTPLLSVIRATVLRTVLRVLLAV